MNTLKTFTSIETFHKGTYGADNNGRIIHVVEPDPKREGLYVKAHYQVVDGDKTRRYSDMYGKKNQADIIAMTKDMIEVK